MPKGTEVFGPLAGDYARYRPGYPTEVLDVLTKVCGLTREWAVADIGSGTGNLAKLFLAAGYQVTGVEPNREMREAGERLLAGYENFRSLDGAAENIPLDAKSVDLITVGQALHWFDVDEAKAEFQRILRPGGWVAVLWNDRLSDATAFTQEYDALTRHYATLQPSPCHVPFLSPDVALARIFGTATPHTAAFPHTQRFDLEGLIGRARSSGYIPQPGAPGYAEFTASMTDLYTRHQCEGAVEFHYIAQLRFGHLEGLSVESGMVK